MTAGFLSPSYRPSVNGFNFVNSFSSEDIMDEMYSVPSWMVRDSIWGLCGGMCFASLDRYFNEELPPATNTAPNKGDSLFKELVRRQESAVDQVGWTKILDYQIRPDAAPEDIGFIPGEWTQVQHSLGHLTLKNHWPDVRDKIRAGIPSTICVIRESRYEVHKIGDNHMVVVYAYTYNADPGEVILHVYDPNHPNEDDVRIGFRTNRSRSRLDAWQSTGENVRGFLRIPYDRTERYIPPATVFEEEEKENLEYLWTLFS